MGDHVVERVALERLPARRRDETRYLARRLVERERALAADADVSTRDARTARPRWRLFGAFLAGIAFTLAALFALAWLLVLSAVVWHHVRFWQAPRIDTDVLALLPEEAGDPAVADATRAFAKGQA